MGSFHTQLANISAVLAGFSITFLAILLDNKERSRLMSVSLAVTTAAAACLLCSALGWGLIGSFISQTTTDGLLDRLQAANDSWLPRAHQRLSSAFVFGLLFLLSMLGLSGWLRGRKLGVFSTSCAILSTLVVWSVLKHMMG